MSRRFVLLGPPASGKGTQAERIAQHFGVPTISTGAILRKEKAEGTIHGLKADEYIREGNLVPDPIIFELVEHWLVNHLDNFLFDGFPRTLQQAVWLDAHLQACGQELDAVFLLDLPEAAIRDRVLNRVICSQCGTAGTASTENTVCPVCGGEWVKRNDDKDSLIQQRLDQYQELTHPLVTYYEQRGVLKRVDADRGIGAITDDLIRLMEEIGGAVL